MHHDVEDENENSKRDQNIDVCGLAGLIDKENLNLEIKEKREKTSVKQEKVNVHQGTPPSQLALFRLLSLPPLSSRSLGDTADWPL